MTAARERGHMGRVSSSGVVPITAVADSRPSIEPIAVSVPPTSAARAQTFRALYDGQVEFVWRNLRRLGVLDPDLDDRTQEVFVVAHRRFDEFEERGHGPRAWLFQIVLRIASEARRHHRRHPEVPDGGNALARATIDAPQADDVARREALSRLDAALDTITLGRRAVLVLHEIEEMTAPEIAQVLGIPLNTVYSRLRVARAELEHSLAQQGGSR
jgi:RNA polymerase sigma-70 factor (ECF subfamily)